VPVSRFRWAWLLFQQLFLQVLLYTGIVRSKRVQPVVAPGANEIAWAAARAAEIHSYDMDMLRALTLSLISVNQVRRGAQENPFGLGVLGYVCASVKLKASRSYFRRARRGAARSSDNQRALADVLHLQASCLISIGRLDRASRVALESVAVAEHIGDRQAASVGLNLAEVCDYLEGKFPRVLITSQDIEAHSAGEHGLLRLCSRALALCELGQPDKALALLQLRAGDQTPQLRVARATSLGVVALAQARHGALPAAWAVVQQSLQMGVGGEIVPAACSVILTGPMVATLKCWAQAVESAPSEVAEYARTAGRILRQLRAYGRVCRPGTVMAWYFAGHVHALRGQRRGSLRAWQRAAESAAKFGMRYYEGLAHLELGRASSVESSACARREHLDRAAALLAQCGVGDYELANDGAGTSARRRTLAS
jgi:tetratricopeptide (TPR) repeat protein